MNTPEIFNQPECQLCPRECMSRRSEGQKGWCGAGEGVQVASVCRHLGEEPVISGSNGICNVFFAHCNLQCVYCQNHQISSREGFSGGIRDVLTASERICQLLESGCHAIGFVSPTHYIPRMKEMIKLVNDNGFKPVIVYNTNAYDRIEVLRLLEDDVDIYLPDFKYADPETSLKYSGSEEYPIYAKAALKEMFRQKGSRLRMLNDECAASGLIIRHLVLPGLAEESIRILQWIAEELSPRVHISLLSQYYPAHRADQFPEISRSLAAEEYIRVQEALEELGFESGWVQDFESQGHYRPDFSQAHPFDANEKIDPL